jgi:hypothetical protein
MLDFVTRPIRWALGVGEHDVVGAVQETRDIEANMLDGVRAIENATASIERHVEVIESLATSVDPLRQSVDRLTETVQELVSVLAPVAAAERDVERVGKLFGRRRHHDQGQPIPPPDAPSASGD